MKLAEMFAEEAEKFHLMSHEILFSEGEAADVMYLLLAGRADLLVRGQTIESAGPGDVVGELALIEPDQPRPASVRAVTDCELIRIDQPRFEHIVAQQPQFAVELMRIMATRLRRGEALA